MSWLLHVGEPGDVELMSLHLWDLGTTGIYEDANGGIVAGFERRDEAASAADALGVTLTPGVLAPAPSPETLASARVDEVQVPGTDIRFTIESGAAFGHGQHSSTALSLELLADQARQRPLGRVLDFGTGTGVLGIAAALLGAERVLAVDNDPNAVTQAIHNRKGAGLSDRLEVRLGSVETLEPEDAFDLVVVNVLLPVHQAVGDDLVAHLHDRAAGGQPALIAAGILDTQGAAVRAAYHRLNPTDHKQTTDSGGNIWLGQRFNRAAPG